jgi:hypothetical protein
VVAAALVACGASRDQLWVVPVGATLALPALWITGLSMLVAVIPPVLGRRGGRAWTLGDAEARGT